MPLSISAPRELPFRYHVKVAPMPELKIKLRDDADEVILTQARVDAEWVMGRVCPSCERRLPGKN
jgi:hypothetical protein